MISRADQELIQTIFSNEAEAMSPDDVIYAHFELALHARMNLV
jgi:hypothetical protein